MGVDLLGGCLILDIMGVPALMIKGGVFGAHPCGCMRRCVYVCILVSYPAVLMKVFPLCYYIRSGGFTWIRYTYIPCVRGECVDPFCTYGVFIAGKYGERKLSLFYLEWV